MSRFSDLFLFRFHMVTKDLYKDVDVKILLESSGNSSRLYLKIYGKKYNTGVRLTDEEILHIIKDGDERTSGNPLRNHQIYFLVDALMHESTFGAILSEALNRKKIEIWRNLPNESE